MHQVGRRVLRQELGGRFDGGGWVVDSELERFDGGAEEALQFFAVGFVLEELFADQVDNPESGDAVIGGFEDGDVLVEIARERVRFVREEDRVDLDLLLDEDDRVEADVDHVHVVGAQVVGGEHSVELGLDNPFEANITTCEVGWRLDPR